MSKNYTQLSLQQRYQIEALKAAGIRQNQIARQLGVHPSTISRELSRNSFIRGRCKGAYRAVTAERKAKTRHREKPKRVLLTSELKDTIAGLLVNERWSPEYISKASGIAGMVSAEWIYRWIWRCKRSSVRPDVPYQKLYKYLRHARRKRKRGNKRDNRGVIPNRVMIDKRPSVVKKRKRAGDIEADLMLGRNQKGMLLVLTDRATLHTRLVKLKNRKSEYVKNEIIKCLNQSPYPVHTITFDNDKAFSCHEKISEALNIQSYFTRPYTSQDKGTVENRIGVIRRFFPRKTDIEHKTKQEIREVERKINNRPVRKFNYQTPTQVLKQKIALIT